MTIETINDDIEEVEATIERLSFDIEDATDTDDVDLWDELTDDIEDANDELNRLVVIRDA